MRHLLIIFPSDDKKPKQYGIKDTWSIGKKDIYLIL